MTSNSVVEGISATLEDVVVVKNVHVAMADGTILTTDLYFPAHSGVADFTQRYPTVLIRSPYAGMFPVGQMIAAEVCKIGYVLAVQDTRGTGQSEGVLAPMVDESWGQHRDGADAVAWLIRQPWSDKTVCTYGTSYNGATQLLLMPMGLPGLMTGSVTAPAVNQFDGGWVTKNGLFAQTTAIFWAIQMAGEALRADPERLARVVEDAARGAGAAAPTDQSAVARLAPGCSLRDAPIVRHIPFYQDWLEHRDDPTFFDANDMRPRYGKVAMPLLHLVGWYDLFLSNTLEAYSEIVAHGATPEARDGQRLIIGPWTHFFDPSPGLRTFPNAEFNDVAAAMAWFDHQVRGIPHPFFNHKVVHYVMGANRWRAEDCWPPKGVQPTRFYVRENGVLSTEPPRADERADRYLFDPADPTPTLRGQNLAGGCVDQRPNDGRTDRVVYTTAPLEHDLEIVGQVQFALVASSSATDTDWHVKLIDVLPDGTAYNLTSGAVRARYRTSRTQPTALEPGATETYVIAMGATSNVFARGHRIRVVIESSDYPNFDLNPNAFVDLSRATSADYFVAEQHIYHDAARPSSIELPLLPVDQERRWIEQPFWEDKSVSFPPNPFAPLPAPARVLDVAHLPQA